MKRFDPTLDAQYTRIFMAAAWPTTRNGFVVVVGEHRQERIAGRPVLVVLDDVADSRLWDLVTKLAALREFYHPERVLADTEHIAAMQFASRYPLLTIEPALLTCMDGPLAYALPVVKRHLESKRLVLSPGSGLRGELLTPPGHEDPAKLKLDDYPGLAAVSFALLALDSVGANDARPRQIDADTSGRVL